MRRTKIASDDLFKLACKQPKELKASILPMALSWMVLSL